MCMYVCACVCVCVCVCVRECVYVCSNLAVAKVTWWSRFFYAYHFTLANREVSRGVSKNPTPEEGFFWRFLSQIFCIHHTLSLLFQKALFNYSLVNVYMPLASHLKNNLRIKTIVWYWWIWMNFHNFFKVQHSHSTHQKNKTQPQPP